MMRATILAAMLATSSPALAADAIETAPVFSWEGGYAGLHAGYGWGRGEASFPWTFGRTLRGEGDFDGGRFGAFIGYNAQLSDNLVAGIEGDLNYDWNKGSIYEVSAKTGISGSIRGRLGVSFDRALIYAAGGWTAANATIDARKRDSVKHDLTLHGWTLGAGVDYAFTDRVFARLEYRHNHFGRKTVALPHMTLPGARGGVAFDTEARFRFNQNVVNIGIGVKF